MLVAAALVKMLQHLDRADISSNGAEVNLAEAHSVAERLNKISKLFNLEKEHHGDRYVLKC